MTITIDWRSVIIKIQKYLNSAEGKRRIHDITIKIARSEGRLATGENVHTPKEAAQKFIEVLWTCIEAAPLTEDALESLKTLELVAGEPVEVAENMYTITVSFVGNLYRPSLIEPIYGGIDDISALLNDGAETKRRIIGYWPSADKVVRSIMYRYPAEYIEKAISEFMAIYAAEYGVVDISRD